MPPSKRKPSKEQQLIEEIRRLRETLERINSVPSRLLKGMVAGIGSAIGATLIAGIAFYILFQAIQGTYIEAFIEQTPFRVPIEQFQFDL